MIRTIGIGLMASLLATAASAQTVPAPATTTTTVTSVEKTEVVESAKPALVRAKAKTRKRVVRACNCAPKKTLRRAKRHVAKRTLRSTSVVQVRIRDKGGDTHTYYTPETGYPVDPWRVTQLVPATEAQLTIADRLNKGLDLWRTCGWRGGDEPARVFVDWSRTHSVPDRLRPGEVVSAEDSYAQTSAYRQRDLGYPVDRDETCAEAEEDFPTLVAQLEGDAKALRAAN